MPTNVKKNSCPKFNELPGAVLSQNILTKPLSLNDTIKTIWKMGRERAREHFSSLSSRINKESQTTTNPKKQNKTKAQPN